MIINRIGLIIYGILSVLESIWNLISYILFLDKIVGVLDVSLPFYFWWTNTLSKRRFLKEQRKNLEATYGKDV